MDHIDSIDRYFDKTNSSDDLDNLKKSMSREEREELAFLEELEVAIAMSEAREKLDSLKKNTQETRVVRMPRRRWLSIAAGVMILVMGGFFIKNIMMDSTSSSLYNEHYAFYPSTKVTRAISEENLSEKEQKAHALYNEKRFEEASLLFEQLPGDEAKFFHGLSLMEQKKWQESIKKLDQVGGKYKSQAIFYHALIKTKLGEYNSAIQLLENVLDKESTDFVKGKAKSLLNDLKKQNSK